MLISGACYYPLVEVQQVKFKGSLRLQCLMHPLMCSSSWLKMSMHVSRNMTIRRQSNPEKETRQPSGPPAATDPAARRALREHHDSATSRRNRSGSAKAAKSQRPGESGEIAAARDRAPVPSRGARARRGPPSAALH